MEQTQQNLESRPRRGRPSGSGRMPLTAQERRKRNASYEKERRDESARLIAAIAKMLGLDPNVSKAEVLAAAVSFVQNCTKELHELQYQQQKNNELKARLSRLQAESSVHPGEPMPGPSTANQEQPKELRVKRKSQRKVVNPQRKTTDSVIKIEKRNRTEPAQQQGEDEHQLPDELVAFIDEYESMYEASAGTGVAGTAHAPPKAEKQRLAAWQQPFDPNAHSTAQHEVLTAGMSAACAGAPQPPPVHCEQPHYSPHQQYEVAGSAFVPPLVAEFDLDAFAAAQYEVLSAGMRAACAGAPQPPPVHCAQQQYSPHEQYEVTCSTGSACAPPHVAEKQWTDNWQQPFHPNAFATAQFEVPSTGMRAACAGAPQPPPVHCAVPHYSPHERYEIAVGKSGGLPEDLQAINNLNPVHNTGLLIEGLLDQRLEPRQACRYYSTGYYS